MTKVDTTHYTYNHTVGAGNGTATIALSTGTDTATNVITAAPTGGASFTVDNLAPTFTMQYYSDVALVNSLGDNPKLKAGTYYVKISASEALTAVPTISIDAEGTANDVTNAATTLVSGNDYKYARVVATDGAAIGTAIEDFSVSGTDNAGNGAVATNPTNEAAAAGYTDTAAPTVANTLTASNNPFSPNADTIKDTTNFSFVSSETGTYTIVVTEIGGTGKTATLSGTMFVGIAKTHTWDGRNGATQLFVDGTHSAVLTITDQAGNVTTSASLNVIIDVMAPTGTIAINGGAVFTNSADVTLTLSANDATSGVSEMQFSNDNATWSGWETFATTKTWTVAIPGTDGMKTVYMQIRDNAGNVMSTEIADIINLDTQDPVITFGTDSVNLAPSQNDHVDATITDANLTAATYGFASTCNSATTGLTEITGVTGSDATRNLAIDVNTEAHNGSKLCIKAIDGSGRTSYIASANAFNIDVTAPVITFSDDVVAGPVQSDTVAITTSDANADTNAYKYILADDNSCNNKDYGAATAFVSGEQISLSPFNTIDYNGKFICAEATDKAGNTQHQASANPINIDVVGPNIDVTFNVDMVNAPKQSATATITVVDPNLDTASMAYIYSSSSDCKQQDYAGATAFTTTPKTVDLTDESQNGKYICVKAADTASNISYQASSNPIHIDVTKPTLTFTDDVDTGPTMSDTITVTETEKNADLLKYAISEDNVCDDTDPRFDFTSVADLGNDQRSATVTFSEELRGKTFCVLATDQAENVSTYLKGAEVLNIDRTVPTAISFTTNSPVSDLNNPATVYGNGEQINIQAIFDEELQDGASLSVKLNNTAKDEVVLNNLDATKKILSGTYTVIQGATHDTSALAVSAFAITPDKELKDIAGNTFVQTDFPADNFNGKLIVVDTEPPSLESFSATIDGQVSGSFKAGKVITVTASYSENLSAGSNAHVKINIAGATDIPLTAISANTLHGTYTILDGDNAANLENLKITSIISQDAIDIINNHLTTVTEIAVGSYVPVVTNIPDGLRIDTTPPSNATITINSGASESKDNLVSLALATDDNFSDLSGMQLELSNDGIAWCDATGIVNQKSAYATTVADWNLTNTVCGTQSAPNAQDKIDAKVFVRFTDGATNPGSSANDTIVFDGVPPRITDISAQFELAKIYGPDMEIPVTVTFSEPLHPTKEIAMTVNFANGGKATDFTRTNENTISGKYIIGDTDSNQDTSNLTITDVTMTSIYDTADNQQTSSTVPGGTDNVSHKGIIIDTTAPEGALRIDRSIGKVYAQVTDSNGMSTANMQMQYAALAQHTDVCTYGEFQAFASEFALTETASLAQKVCAKFKDEAGNISLAAISVTPETPQNVQYTDLTNANIDPNYKGMFISWQMPTTEEGTLGFLQYELQWCHDNKDSAECTPTSQSDGTITDISHNYFTHNNMEDEKYCYRLRFKDKNQDYSKFSDKHCVIPGENMIATDSETAITNVAVGAETNSGAQVSFTTVNAKNNLNTPLATRATLTVYDNSALADTNQVAQIVDKDYNVNHVIKITGLTKPSTQYYFKLEATDASIETNPHRTTMLAYEATTHPELTFTTLGALSIITLINDSVTTDSKAVIEFKTDQNAKCFIHYWTMAGTVINDNGTTGLEGEYKKNHTVTITDLLFPDTSYSYTISCSDADNATVTLDNDFKTSNKTLSQSDVTVTAGDTTAPEISGVAISALKGESASITWNTNEKANSLVAYELEGATYTMMAGDYAVNVSASTYSTAHSVMINNLIPATKYNFSVISSDASGNIAQSSQSAFTTSEPSSLSSVKVISKALNQATFSWQTGSDTTSIVEYGLTTAYGETKKSQASTKVHELTIADLKAGSTYHFRVKGADAQGNLFASNDSTFEPKSPPKIADFKVDEITEHGAKLTFTTNVPTDTLVAFTDADKEENSGVQGKSEFATKHELVLKNLASGVTFGLNLKVRDEDGNETEETFPSFQTSKDENAPKIDQIKTSSALSQTDKVQSIISWLTDEGATSTLAYREGRDGNDTTVNASDKLATNHISVITSFKPGTVYYFRVKAKDEAGNESTSTEYAILTPRRKENIIQIILANFQDIFKWAQK